MRIRCGLFIMTLLLAACGGGGGGGGTTGVTVPPPVATSSPGGPDSQTVQRGDAQAALAGVEAYENDASGGNNVLTVRRILARSDVRFTLAHLRRATSVSSGCENGQDETVSSVSGNTASITIEIYYDANCTTLESELVWTATESATASGDVLTGPATYTAYASNGTTVSETASAQVTLYTSGSGENATTTGVGILFTNIEQGGASIGSAGVACLLATEVCSIAAVSSASTGSTGVVVTGAASVSSMSMQFSTYAGSSLTIAQATFPDWTITPASDLTGSDTITGGASSGGGFTLTLTDSTNDVTVAVTGTAAGTVSGTLTQTGSTTALATFTIDSSGDGTLTYAGGTQVSIEDYIVQS